MDDKTKCRECKVNFELDENTNECVPFQKKNCKKNVFDY